MIAYADISLALNNIFATNNFVTNKRELAKYPRPGFHKKVSNRNSMFTKEGGENNAWQKQKHKYSKHQKDPDFIKN